MDRQAGNTGSAQLALHAGTDIGIDILEPPSKACKPASLKAGKLSLNRLDEIDGFVVAVAAPVSDEPICNSPPRLSKAFGIEQDIEGALHVTALIAVTFIRVGVHRQSDSMPGCHEMRMAALVVDLDNWASIDAQASTNPRGQMLPEGSVPAPAMGEIAIEDAAVLPALQIKPVAAHDCHVRRVALSIDVINSYFEHRQKFVVLKNIAAQLTDGTGISIVDELAGF